MCCTHLLDVLQRDAVLPELLVDEDEGVEVSHPPVEQLVRQPARSFHYSLVKLQQSGRKNKESLVKYQANDTFTIINIF